MGDSTVPTTNAQNVGDSTVPTTTFTPSMSFTFGELDGLGAVDDPQLTDYPTADETITAWSGTAGVTDAYLAVKDIPAGDIAVGSAEGDISMTPIAAPTGQAFLAIDNGVRDPQPSSATRIMWWRDDGRLWIASNYGLTPERLTDLVLAIQPGDDGTLTLSDASMVPLGSCNVQSFQSLVQEWTLDGHSLELAITNGGLTQQLNDLPITAIEPRTVAGRDGYAVTLPNGQVNLIWPTHEPGWWASITSGPALADHVDALAAVVTDAA